MVRELVAVRKENWFNGVAQETERFFLTEVGIGIHYDVYELANYASGAQYIIPYSEFRIKEQ